MNAKNPRLPLVLFVCLACAQLACLPERVIAQACLPTCADDDGRLLSLAGDQFGTLADQSLSIVLAVAPDRDQVSIEIFDGDTNLGDFLVDNGWDGGLPPASTLFSVFEDPNCDGTGLVLAPLAIPGPNPIDGQAMINGDWFEIVVPTSPSAQAPSGVYCYNLFVELADPTVIAVNNFKLRTDATIRLGSQPFAFSGGLQSFGDIFDIYPELVIPPGLMDPCLFDPSELLPTTYDGSFSFFLDVFTGQEHLAVWDGDVDRGKFDGTDLDTDDPDTPADLPPWSVPDVVPEDARTAAPRDDQDCSFFVRPPSVLYDVALPDGGPVFRNDNPSANREWEQFRIDTAPFDVTIMDVSTASLPPGSYEVRTVGTDLQNLNAWLFNHTLMGVTPAGEPVEPLRPFLVGDTVFADDNENAVQDASEFGIGGVLVELIDSMGNVLATATTGGGGQYSFPVEGLTTRPGLIGGVFQEVVIYDGVYSVRVAASNFSPGGPLAGSFFTTPGDDLQTNTVIDDNVLTYDFGLAGRDFAPPVPAPALSAAGIAGASLMLVLAALITERRRARQRSFPGYLGAD